MAQAATRTDTLTAAQITKYQSEFLRHFEERTIMRQFGQAAPVPDGTGKTLDWFRYHPLAKKTSADSEGLTSYTYKNYLGMNITATLTEWGDQVSFSMLHWHTSRDRHLTKAVDTLSQQAAESIEYEILFQLQRTGVLPLHPKAVTSLGVVSTSWLAQNVKLVSATSTTVVRLSDSMMGLSGKAVNDAFNGGWVCIQYGAGYGHASRIADYASANRVLTLSTASPETPQSSGNTNPTQVTLVSPFRAALTASETLHVALLQKALEILRKGGARPFEDGYYVGLMSPEIESQLMSDRVWKEQAYRASYGEEQGYRGAKLDTMIWNGIRWFRLTKGPRYVTTAKTMNAMSQTTGNVFLTMIMGQDAFGVPALEGMAEPQFSVKVPQANDGNTSNPRNSFGTHAWNLWWTVKPLNANFNVGIFSYAA